MRARLWWLALGVASTIVGVDQVTKTMALRALADGPIDLVWTLRLNLTLNSGAAFGLAKGVTPLVVGAGVLLLVAVLVTGRRLVSVLGAIALGLVLGGALGNLGDRFVRGHGGAVVDFIDLQWWPVFNVADMAISVGAALLVIAGLRDENRASAP